MWIVALKNLFSGFGFVPNISIHLCWCGCEAMMGLLSMATCQDHYSPAPAPAPTAGHKSRIYVLTPPAGLLPYHGLGGIKLQSAVTKVIALVCISYNSKNLSSSDCFFNGTCKIFFIGSSLDWRLGKQTKNPFEEIIKLWVIPINIAEMDHYKYTHKILCWPDCIWPTFSCHVHTAATWRRLLWPQVEPISCL